MSYKNLLPPQFEMTLLAVWTGIFLMVLSVGVHLTLTLTGPVTHTWLAIAAFVGVLFVATGVAQVVESALSLVIFVKLSGLTVDQAVVVSKASRRADDLEPHERATIGYLKNRRGNLPIAPVTASRLDDIKIKLEI